MISCDLNLLHMGDIWHKSDFMRVTGSDGIDQNLRRWIPDSQALN